MKMRVSQQPGLILVFCLCVSISQLKLQGQYLLSEVKGEREYMT